MAKRGREAMAKRARELARQDKQATKREKRDSRGSPPGAELPPVDTVALMEEFARLSEQHSSNQITEPEYTNERRRIFEELGIDSGE